MPIAAPALSSTSPPNQDNGMGGREGEKAGAATELDNRFASVASG
ncbi:MAG: hypothetical protein V3V15_12225 [Sphingorhabdus sp.]